MAILVALFLPLLGFFLLLYPVPRKIAGLIGCGTILLSFLIFAGLCLNYTEPYTLELFRWIDLPSMQSDFRLHLDPLSFVMTLVITGVGSLIHIYSYGYMDHDENYGRFFACMNFFVFAMLLLVLAGDLLLLFVGWEGVGIASYLLIGFYYAKPSAAAAATKAFVMNRIGDVGFLLGILLTYSLFGTTDISKMTAGETGILTMLLFIGAIGKSAQIPLHTWLPDAMEGPTPVSALIHAATMVTAGVYLVVRLHPLYLASPTTLEIVGVVGAVTSLYASLSALGQTDLKKVLAYSTVSQLGLMFVACGIGAFFAAIFHLVAHAWIKATLFLSAGNVVHMMHGKTEMEEMGGLAKYLRKTNWLFLIGALALAGIPPLAAFFSKDLILQQEYLSGRYILFAIALLASILTGVYLMRAYFLTFQGKDHGPPPSEAPAIMTLPVSVLAFFAIVGGALGHPLEKFLEKVGIGLPRAEPAHFFTPEMILTVLGAILGVGITAYIYSRYQLKGPIAWLKQAFYVDDLYDKAIVSPLKSLADGIAHVTEPKVFEGSIDGSAEIAERTSHWLQKLQSGQIRSYVAWIALGAVFLIGGLLIHG